MGPEGFDLGCGGNGWELFTFLVRVFRRGSAEAAEFCGGNRVVFFERRCISRGWRSKVTVAGSGSHLFVDVCAGAEPGGQAAHAALKRRSFTWVGGFAAPLAEKQVPHFVRNDKR